MSQLPITISGNLTDDPKFKGFSTGTSLTRLRVATSRRVPTDNLDSQGRPLWVDVDSLYIDVECWGQLAVNTYASLSRGMPVVVIGRLVTETWNEENGTPRSRNIIKANQVALELSRLQASSRSTTTQEHTAQGVDEVKLLDREEILRKEGVTQVASSSGGGDEDGGDYNDDRAARADESGDGVLERSGTIDEADERELAHDKEPVPVG